MKKVTALLALALAAVALASCGKAEGTANPESEPDTILRFETPPGKNLAYTSTEASTEAGYVAVEFNNPQSTRHNVAFEDSSGKVIGETDKIFETATVRIMKFEPGEYTFYCALDDHRKAGMEGTLIVK
jgi:plastocyanin